ncbi:ADP-ribose pyrophosphatase [Melghiribacillus thermohalophilus]|uniref:ADP-ribose pyrophosphatase n=1 Tax=Melghiribacillus thermohalophilus TaxID=1324956 RepID=A0A4R3NEK7_9BACI|nr:NUDIX hydrolase [Melghiribacillus thermohalophilus]TCT25652.1 ADP-ribose pyrophosphatase [Melghiribacillus thermohalophilus]
MKKFEEKTIESETIFEGKVVQLQVDRVKLPNGKESHREMIKHPGAVAVIPVTSDNKIVLVEQYRKPLERSLVEIPAGKLEEGEPPEKTAHRELEEETGYLASEMTYITSFYTSPGFADEIIHLYLATGLKKADEPLGTDEDEFVEIMECTLEEAQKLINEKKIYDAKTAYALLYLSVMKNS